MKQVSKLFVCLSVMMLAGCSVNPSVLGTNIAGIGGEGGSGPGATTGSIVPLSSEGEVVDLPSASEYADKNNSDQMQVLSAHQEGAVRVDGAFAGQADGEPEQALSAQERHRRELINRGDLQEGQPLPVD